MDEKKRIPLLTIALIITALVFAVALIFMTLLSMPRILEQEENLNEQLAVNPTQAPTEAPTRAPTEPEPTLPPPEENPFDRLDFQYEGRYLKLIEGRSVIGIDVSRWQQTIDWEQVKASGVEFAMIRLGYRGYEEGGLNVDNYATEYLEGAIAAGLDVGVYFFSQALTPEEAAREAAWCVTFLENTELEMPLVFDWEHVESAEARTAGFEDGPLLTACAKSFCDVVSAAGYEPMVYFNVYQAKDLYDLTALGDYGFWLAQYVDGLDYPHAVDLWQYTESGEVDGIQGRVDLNLWLERVEE